MKLRNKKTGQVGNFIINKDHFECVDLDYVPEYRNLAELNEEWGDYEEPKTYWHIDDMNLLGIAHSTHDCYIDDFHESIGNYFETREEAQEALDKLKALKRLKDKGLLIGKCTRNQTGTYSVLLSWDDVPPARKDVDADMRLVFGGDD